MQVLNDEDDLAITNWWQRGKQYSTMDFNYVEWLKNGKQKKALHDISELQLEAIKNLFPY